MSSVSATPRTANDPVPVAGRPQAAEAPQTMPLAPADPSAALAESADQPRLNPLPQGQGRESLSFVDDRPGPRPDLFGGYAALGVREPEQVLQGQRHSAVYAEGSSLSEAVQRFQTPDAVTGLLQPFGSLVYDYDRAANGTGPSGAQSPEQTLRDYAGICRDSHQLGAYLLQENGYDAIQIGYKSEGVMHAVLSYEGKNGEGFGLVEYGTHYSPEQIAAVLGRPALSHEEALLAVRPEAKLINRYSRPEASEEGHITGLYYTMGNLLYQESLQLSHQNSLDYSPQRGLELEAALSENWGIKLNLNNGNVPDPTARDAASLAVGYQVGDSANWMRASVGLQYRPEEGHHSIGRNQWESNPALVAGAHVSAQWTPLQADFNPHHRTETRVGANLTAGLAFTDGGGSNASGGTHDAGWGLNDGLSAGLGQASLRLGQHFSGELSDHFSYQSEAFINPDVLAAAYGYGSGGSGLYANTGVNGSLHYQNDNWNAHVGGQYLFTQVNNLEATGVNAGLGYQSGRVGFQTQAGMLDSPEGWRLQTRQQINLNLTDKVQAFGYATQEQVFNDTHGRINLNAGNQFGLGLRANF